MALVVLQRDHRRGCYLGQAKASAAACPARLTCGRASCRAGRARAMADATTWRSSRHLRRNLYELYRRSPRDDNATSSSTTRPRCGGTAGTSRTRSGWRGPGRSTGPTRPGRDRRSTAFARGVSPAQEAYVRRRRPGAREETKTSAAPRATGQATGRAWFIAPGDVRLSELGTSTPG